MSSPVRQATTHADAALLQNTAALVVRARGLSNAEVLARQPLRGKRLALLSDAQGDDSAREFVQAATALGAHVSLVLPGLDEGSSEAQIDAVARMLGRLYDAVECQHLPLAVVRRISQGSDIPIFAGLATPEHPTAGLADELPGSKPLDLRRCRILQAALLLSLN
ncbi:ornithine carbamoyltransferase [Roseateles sp. LYH14W]|uniref:Ornithine carbamoyltransferase n=1 Tax=Pelomonas parva TaxID=3299032 RepID=A0ABW7F9W6_9BURK